MNNYYRATLILVALMVVLLMPVVALAGTQSWSNEGITIVFTTPDTYSLCPIDTTSDTITVTGLPMGWMLSGWVETQYIIPTGRQSIQTSLVDFTSDGVNPFTLDVEYPPISQWPATHEPDDGLREIHVDISISVYDESGFLAGWLGGDLINAPGTLGPGNDWDVFCFYTPPPPPPSDGVGTPGYWKNHSEDWPVDEITIGGITFSKEEAIAIIDMPDGDKSYTLFRALLASKLNVLIGNDQSCIVDTMAAADAWMVNYPVGSSVDGNTDAWKDGEPLYEILDQYNNGYLCAVARD